MQIFQINRTYQHIRRYQQIIRVLVKYGFDDILERIRLDYYLRLKRKLLPGTIPKEIIQTPRAQRIRMAFEELGPTFIKLGQILSVRPDLIPPDYAEEFTKLLDDVPSFPFKTAVKLIESELKQPVEKLYKEINSTPLSAASIAQVHQAVTHDGKHVVIKIQRPGIRRLIDQDIAILYDLARMTERYIEESHLYNPVAIVDEFARTIRNECDFIREGRNIDRFRKYFEGDETIYLPRVYWSLTTERVLTMEFIKGTKLTQLDKIKLTPEQRKIVANNGARAILKEIFEFGFFHADPHPANIFLLDDLTIAPIDFGIVGTLDETVRDYLGLLLRGIAEKDVDKVIRAFFNMGYLDYDLDVKGLRRDLYDFLEQYYGLPLKEIRLNRVLGELFEIIRRYHIRIPADLSLMVKALVLENSLGQKLYPDFDIFELAQPYARKLIMQKYRPGRQLAELSRFSEESFDFLKELPMELRTILQRAKKGDLSFRMEHHGLERFIQEMDRSSNRIAFSLIIAALIIGSSLIIQLNKGPFLFGFSLLGIAGYLIAGLLGLWLVIAILRSGKL